LFFVFFIAEGMQKSFVRFAPMFLGLSFARADDANFSSPRSRKIVESANKIYNLQEEIDVFRRQRAFEKQSASEKFHVRCFVRPSTGGFQAVRVAAGDLKIQECGANISDVVSLPAPEMFDLSSLQLVDELLELLCKSASAILGEATSRMQRGSLRLSSGSSLKLFSLLNLSNPNSATALQAILNGSLLQLICRESNGESRGTHWLQLHKLLLQGMIANCHVCTLSSTVVVHLELVEDRRSRLVSQYLQETSQLQFWLALGVSCACLGLHNLQFLSISSLQKKLPKGLTLHWLPKRDTLKGNKPLKKNPDDASSKQEAARVMSALESLSKDALPMSNCPFEIHLVANRAFINVNWRIAPSAHSPPCPAISHLDPLVKIQDQDRPKIVVAEFVLEKVGMPHEFVFQDITAELHFRQDLQWLAELPSNVAGALKTTVLSHCGVIDGNAHTIQLCRIRGPAAAFEALKNLASVRDTESCVPQHLSIDHAQKFDSSKEAVNEFLKSSYYRIHNPVVVLSEDFDFSSPQAKRDALQEVKRFHEEASKLDLSSSSRTTYTYDLTLRRLLPRDRNSVLRAIESIGHFGFFNYFGPQRFGPQTSKGMHPGLHLLKSEYQAAAYLLIKEVRPQESNADEEAKSDTSVQRVFREALAASISIERDSEENLLGTTASNDACCEVFHNILGPSVIRSLVQEFLVFVWNEVLSHRVVAYGCRILVGDLVRLNGATNSIHFVTEDDIIANRWKVADVLLPIPGAGVLLPRNETREIYRRTLQSYGILFDVETGTWPIFGNGDFVGYDNLNCASNDTQVSVDVVDDDDIAPGEHQDVRLRTNLRWTPASVRGGYRPMVWIPRFATANLSYPPLDKSIPQAYWAPVSGTGSLRLSFDLPLGVYASMLVRELTKLDVAFMPLDGAASSTSRIREKRLQSLSTMKNHDRGLYQTILNKKRKKNIALAPMAIQQASLHQRIFRSSGMRRSLIPAARGRDDVSK
jgi:tRNA(Glu) U13 pseudouridine synthase TruD